MLKSRIASLGGTIILMAAIGCTDPGAPRPLQQLPTTNFRVAILANANDSRIATVREAMTHWNAEFQRLGVDVGLDTGTIGDRLLSDAELRAASDEVLSTGQGPAVQALRANLAAVSADIVILLSDTDLISFALSLGTDRQGIVVLRTASVLPLSLPNTVRNVTAHELGHVFGLGHNPDPAMLMCGRPSSCRPDAFASQTPRFFPLTAAEESWLQQRQWP